ncbi:L-aspartate oxidase [Bacillus sp. AFS002410]|uniref:L-aspartate oxidase n=1 Tax=Bacillus sp. AFS002410 TaxID=2033481 RepID=UPI000BEF3CC4|nr:L-aspartate oxidase [Bacillus sp. AFS002410]PEJ56574.1 L-aspartate oxidase [Bacillus sp. AFS002410]
MRNADVVIIGSGIAALMAAEEICQSKNVILFTKKKIWDSNSMLAQGGIAAVMSEDDSWKIHKEDTLIAGCNVNNIEAVEELVKNGTMSMKDLVSIGMVFDKDETGQFHLGREGAHRKNRILHAGGDATGKHLVETVYERIKDKITIIEDEMAIDLMIQDGKCKGVFTLNEAGEIISYVASTTLLATGGIGAMYQFSSNNKSITGDGIAMAYRAGCEMADLEFIQFHPTMLYINGACKGLVSEAVRGEGACLVTKSGRRIMKGLHPFEDLAPRDVVSRAIFNEMQNGEEIYLSIEMINGFEKRFPTITSNLINNGIDLKKGLIPVVPGAHFHMGGVKTSTNGETTIPGLYAVGEVACTGVHGANRLASNSLLEGIVFGKKVAKFIANLQSTSTNANEQKYMIPRHRSLPTKDEIKEKMMKYIGIVRNEVDLEKAISYFSYYLESETLDSRPMSKDELERYNMLTTGKLIAEAALGRKESIGSHFIEYIDQPATI